MYSKYYYSFYTNIKAPPEREREKKETIRGNVCTIQQRRNVETKRLWHFDIFRSELLEKCDILKRLPVWHTRTSSYLSFPMRQCFNYVEISSFPRHVGTAILLVVFIFCYRCDRWRLKIHLTWMAERITEIWITDRVMVRYTDPVIARRIVRITAQTNE